MSAAKSVWRAALLRAARRRRRLHLAGLGIGACCALLGATMVFPPPPLLVWNASASAPIGLYIVAPWARVRTGKMVVARLPAHYRALAAARGYLPANVPLVKRVAAGPGDLVCAEGQRVRVNARAVVIRRSLDGLGRPLPGWEGCWRIGARQHFLLMENTPDSFDGRYFGLTDDIEIIGPASLIWAR